MKEVIRVHTLHGIQAHKPEIRKDKKQSVQEVIALADVHERQVKPPDRTSASLSLASATPHIQYRLTTPRRARNLVHD